MKNREIYKKILIFVLVFISSLSLFACFRKADDLEKREFSITGSDTVEVGESIKLELNNTIDSDIIEWSSSDESIASITNDGIISGLSEGLVTIKCLINGKEISYDVKVSALVVEITINGISELRVGDTYKFTYSLSKDVSVSGSWFTSDESILSIDSDGNVLAINEGNATITYKLNNTDNSASYNLKVTKKVEEPSISIVGDNKVLAGSNIRLSAIITNDDNYKISWSSNDTNIATVDSNGVVYTKRSGIVIIKAYIDGTDYESTISINVIDSVKVSITGNTNITVGKVNEYKIVYNISGYDLDFDWIDSDNLISQTYVSGNTCYLIGVKTGSIELSIKNSEKNIFESLDITIDKMEQTINYTDEEIAQAESILNNMTIEQKVGQMFIFSTSSETTFSSKTESYISTYHFGNVIYMGGNCKDTKTLAKMSNSYQDAFNKYNGISGFISTDQEGGTVSRITTGGTHFISEMGLSATGDANNAYLEGKGMGSELHAFGINTDFSPVMDVNNNPSNPIIGIRSYSDNSVRVSSFGVNMIDGLKESGVMACAKHFPGHGNTDTDSHYGLPTITSNLNDLYQTELVPFIASIANGIDAIMTTHIIFSCIDSNYPATLSSKVLQGLLRDTLGYNGLIITDGMEMAAIKSYFGTNDVTSVMAVKAGADILTYTGVSGCITAYNGVLNAVKSGDITVDRINESVKRIILTKIRYGLVDNYKVSETYPDSIVSANRELALDLAKKSITLVKGAYDIKKAERVLIVSTTSSYTIDSSLDEQSFGCYATNYLKKLGYNVSYKTIASNNITDSESSTILESLSNYDKVIMAFSNVKTKNYTNTIKFVNNVLELKQYSIVIALQTPYDGMAYQNMRNYVCAYSYQEYTVKALTYALAKEYTLSGDLPIDKALFN